MMKIRTAQKEDFERIMQLYDIGRAYQIAHGNPTQWPVGYPSLEQVQEDIALQQSYVCEEQGKVVAVFAFVGGEDNTYRVIEDGAWLNEEPYMTIHRLASDGTQKGIASFVFEWCSRQYPNIRIDTHADNKIMQHVILNNNFHYCGRIYVEDHTPRLAYQRIAE